MDQMSKLAHACRKFVREYEARSDTSMFITLGESDALFDLRYEIHKIDEALR